MSFVDYLEIIVDFCFGYVPRRKPKSVNLNDVRLIAHRGAFQNKQKIFENTNEAFALALELGCWGIELDIHETKDKVWVVNHDSSLKRLWNQDIAIKDLTFQELRTLVPQILSLEEVVARYGKKLHLFIEIKHPLQNEAELLRVLEPLKPQKDYHLLALKESIVASFSAFPSTALMLVPIHNNVGKFCKLSLEKNYGGVLAHYSLLTLAQKNALTKASQTVGVGFVNSKFSLYRELKRGHTWLFTNSAKDIVRHMKELTKTRRL